MPGEQQYDLTQVVKDPGWLNASVQDKIAYLSAHDPDFAKASPQDKAGYINHLMGNDQPTQFEKERTKEGFLSHAGQWVKAQLPQSGTDVLRMMVGAVSPEFAARGAAESTVGEFKRAREAGHGVPYSAAAAANVPLGVSAERMERAAEAGDPGGVLGEAAIPTAAALTGIKEVRQGLGNAARATRTTLSPAARPFRTAATRIAEPFGVGVSGEQLLKKGVSPRASALRYDESVSKAARDIVEYHKNEPITSVKALDEAIPEIKKKVWSQEVEPATARHAEEPLAPERTARIRQSVLDSVSQFTEEFDPSAAKQVRELAEKMGRMRTIGEAVGGPKGGLLGYINRQLDSYFTKYPSAKRRELMNNPDTAAWEGARRALREEVMQHLEDAGEVGVRDARARYGALEEISREVERRVNVAERQKPVSLYRMLGWLTAGPTGGLGLALGETAHYLNKPDVLVKRAISRMAKQETLRPERALPPAPKSTASAPKPRVELSAPQSKVMGAMLRGAALPDEIVTETGLSASQVYSTLSELEMKNLAVRRAGNRFHAGISPQQFGGVSAPKPTSPPPKSVGAAAQRPRSTFTYTPPPPKAVAAPTPKPKSTPRSESLATYYSLTEEMRGAIDAQAVEHSHLPQALREGRDHELAKYGGSGTHLKERMARELARDEGLPVLGEGVSKRAGDIQAEIKFLEKRSRELNEKMGKMRTSNWQGKNNLIKQMKQASEKIEKLKGQLTSAEE